MIRNVLSLFDGMSCGRLALNKAKIPFDRYFASEIDNHAIKVATNNFSNTICLGDVTQIKHGDVDDVDLIIGGSPCQGFSTLGTMKGFNDPRSKLFFEFVRIVDLFDPKYFLLENVPMNEANRNIISKYLGVAPVMINSSLVSAQNRKRFYWTNIPNVQQPLDKNIFLEDIIEDPECFKPIVNWRKYVPETLPCFVDPYNKRGVERKSTTLRTNIYTGNMWVKTNNGYRNLLVSECEKLQTVPVGYTSCVSEAQAKRC